MMTTKTLRQSTQLANERVMAPVIVDGDLFYSISDAEKHTGWSKPVLRRMVRPTPGDDKVLVDATSGVRFIRKPRHKGDERSPVYYDLATVPSHSRKRGDG